jgi:hypothetical protein
MKNSILPLLLAMVLATCGCQHTYGVRLTGEKSRPLPFAEASNSLDSILEKQGFVRVEATSRQADNSGRIMAAVAEWRKVYQQDFMWGGGFVYVAQYNKATAIIISVSQTNGNPMRSLAQNIKTELERRFPDWTAVLDSHICLGWSWAK